MHAFAKVFARFRYRLILIVLLMVLTLGIGTVGFVWIEGVHWFDSFYMTLITVTTIGYGEMFPLSHAGRVFNSFLILTGTIGVLTSFGVVTQTVIELELNQYFGRRRTKSMIDKLEGHVIVCGYGRVGQGAVDELMRSEIPFIIIDSNEDRCELAMKEGLLAVCADASLDETLREVGIARARGLIATLGSDADNLFVILSARGLNSVIQLTARIAEESSAEKMRRAGANFVFAPYSSTGHRMAQAIVRPQVAQFLDFSNHSLGLNVVIEQFQVSSRSPWVDRSIGDMDLRQRTGSIILAIRRSGGRMHFNPSTDDRIEIGDVVITIGEREGLRKFERMLSGLQDE
jgi:voltage-gated potassium channel